MEDIDRDMFWKVTVIFQEYLSIPNVSHAMRDKRVLIIDFQWNVLVSSNGKECKLNLILLN